MGYHALLQGAFRTQGLNSHLLHLLHWQAGSLPLALPGKPQRHHGLSPNSGAIVNIRSLEPISSIGFYCFLNGQLLGSSWIYPGVCWLSAYIEVKVHHKQPRDTPAYLGNDFDCFSSMPIGWKDFFYIVWLLVCFNVCLWKPKVTGQQLLSHFFKVWQFLCCFLGFPGVSVVKNLPAIAGDVGLIPGLGRSPGEGNGKSHEQRSLVGYSPWDHKELDTT